ncbi:MAG TPA: VOC family protein [Sphingobacterium sp.]|nr:VOC family protein [Sphingobacterium sp.]
MIKVHAYLNFNGTCEEAFKFYEKVFKKENLGIYRFGDMPADPDYPMSDTDKNKVMHTAIQISPHTLLMGSDCIEGFGHQLTSGNNTYVMLDTETAAEAGELYQALTEDAQNIEMELAEQHWAELYGSFQDKFGIWWMIHFEGDKAQ